MANTLREYDPARTDIVWNGILIFGYADEVVTIEMNEDLWSEDVGSTGDPVRVRNNNESGLVTVTLQHATPCNDLLFAMYAIDHSSAQGKGPLLVKYDGRVIAQATESWIKKAPAQGMARTHGNRQWPIACARLRPFVLGSVR